MIFNTALVLETMHGSEYIQETCHEVYSIVGLEGRWIAQVFQGPP